MARRLASPKLQIKSRFAVWLRQRRNIPSLVETIGLGDVCLHLSVADTSVLLLENILLSSLRHNLGAFLPYSARRNVAGTRRETMPSRFCRDKQTFVLFFTLYLQCFLIFFITDKDFCAGLEPLTCSPASRRFSLGGIKDQP